MSEGESVANMSIGRKQGNEKMQDWNQHRKDTVNNNRKKNRLTKDMIYLGKNLDRNLTLKKHIVRRKHESARSTRCQD